MNRIIGIAIVLGSAYFLLDLGMAGKKLFTIMAAVKYLLNGAFYLFTAYAGVHLIATSGPKK